MDNQPVEQGRFVDQPPFAFIDPNSELVEQPLAIIYDRLSPDASTVLRTHDGEFRHLLAVNRLFSSGHDSFAGAKLEFLRTIHEKGGDYTVLAKEWSIPVEIVDRYIADGSVIQENSSLSLEAYAMSNIRDIASGRTVQTEQLERLVNTLRVFSLGKTNVLSDNAYPTLNRLYGIEACIKDLMFWQESPRAYSFANTIATRTTGIDPVYRYNVEYLTQLANSILESNNLVHKRRLKDRIRVVGSVAPVKSIMTELSRDAVVEDELQKLAGGKDFSQLEEALKAGISPDPAVSAIIERGFVKYDKLRCRIHTLDTGDFDTVTHTVDRARTRLLNFRRLIQALRLRPPDNPDVIQQLASYMRLTSYDGRTSVRNTVPISDKPHQQVVDHMAGLPEGHLGYAAAHIRMPVVVPTNQGKSLPIFEVQIRLGGEHLDIMYGAAEAVYDTDDKTFSSAGLTPGKVKAICDGAREETEQLKDLDLVLQ